VLKPILNISFNKNEFSNVEGKMGFFSILNSIAIFQPFYLPSKPTRQWAKTVSKDLPSVLPLRIRSFSFDTIYENTRFYT
jgi:hypothetical protein